MKFKIIFSLLVILLFLTACNSESGDEIVINVSDVKDAIGGAADSVKDAVVDAVDKTAESEEEVEPVVEEEQNILEELDASELLIEKRIGEYEYERTKSVSNKIVNGFSFKAFEAYYSYGTMEAVVSVLYSDNLEKVNVVTFLDNIKKNEKYIFLDDEDIDYLDQDVYYNPYENIYLWVSEGRVITIEYGIGTDLLLKYLEKHPASIVKGSYENEEISLELKEGESKLILLNNNQYLLKLIYVDSSELQLSVNGVKSIFEHGERGVVGDLLIDVTEVNNVENTVNINIEREAFNMISQVLDMNEVYEFNLMGQNSLTVTGVNSDAMSVVFILNDEQRTMAVGQTRLLGDLEIKLDSLFINTLGETTVKAKFEIWSRS
jgi:hypothetical protein